MEPFDIVIVAFISVYTIAAVVLLVRMRNDERRRQGAASKDDRSCKVVIEEVWEREMGELHGFVIPRVVQASFPAWMSSEQRSRVVRECVAEWIAGRKAAGLPVRANLFQTETEYGN